MFSPLIQTLLELAGLTNGPVVHEVHRVCVFHRNEARGQREVPSPRRCIENGPFFRGSRLPTDAAGIHSPGAATAKLRSGFV